MVTRYQQTFIDGKGKKPVLLQVPLKDGEQGNVQTLGEMIAIVQADRLKADLRRFVLQNIVGSDVKGHDFEAEIKKIFNFAQKEIVYRKDPVKVERVMDLWTILYGTENAENHQPEGDCGIKSVFLATCLALLGHKPVFVVIKQDPNSDSFNHIYNGVADDSGKIRFLDATPEDKPIGYEPQSLKKFIVPIF